MSISQGITRLKIAWASCSLSVAFAVALLLFITDYRPDLSKPMGMAVLAIGISLALPPFLGTGMAFRLFLMGVGTAIGIAFIAGLDQARWDRAWGYSGLTALLAVLAALIWAIARWVFLGFVGPKTSQDDVTPKGAWAVNLREGAEGFRDGLRSADEPTKPMSWLRRSWLTALLAISVVMAIGVFPYGMWTEGWEWGDVGGLLIWVGAGLYSYARLSSSR